MKPTLRLAMFCAIALIVFACAPSEKAPGTPGSDPPVEEPPVAEVAPEDRVVLFGDLHSHTTYSFDSYTIWNSNTQDDAYNFAKGLKPLPVAPGAPDGEATQPVLTAPLDFAGITDHAEWLGELDLCLDPDSTVYDDEFCQRTRAKDINTFYELIDLADEEQPERHAICGPDGTLCTDRARTVWQEIQGIAETHNDPGNFTTLIAYEYTGLVENAGMQHRNVFFRNDKVPADPVTAIEQRTAAELWQELVAVCNDNDALVGCEALTIAHNPNYSWGQMLDPADPDQNYVLDDHDTESLALRARMEPQIEMTQTKGASECYNGLGGSTDEACDFEQLFPICGTEDTTTHHCVDKRAFVRNGFKEGLVLEQDYGVNPFKFGVIASMDTHSGIPGATEEDQYNGHHGASDVTAALRLGVTGEGGVGGLTENPGNNPGGLAGVVADANSRDAIFSALKRKETFGTSGTRITVRFFGSFNYPQNVADINNPIEVAYQLGVPMGSDLAGHGVHLDPSFFVWATVDPNSAPLQKVQIIKGWNEGTATFEEVHDVICADGSTPSPGAECAQTGTVNLDDCSYSPAQPDGSNGAAELKTLWTDPDFDSNQRAFYYVRVLENPTCRWSTYDALELGLALDGLLLGHLNLAATIQERAWSSPIWYTPDS